MNLSKSVQYIKPTIEVVNSTAKFAIEAVFSTLLGSWEPSDNPDNRYIIEQQYRDKYLRPFRDPDFPTTAGGDHHVMVYILNKDNHAVNGITVNFVGRDGNNGVSQVTNDGGSTNLAMFPSSSFNPEVGEPGYWCVSSPDMQEKICGFGMPEKQHVTWWIVLRESEPQQAVKPEVITRLGSINNVSTSPTLYDLGIRVSKIEDYLKNLGYKA